MTRFRMTSAALLALAALAAPGLRAQQSPKPAPKTVCSPIRYKTLRDIPDESRTYEQQMEFERLQRACADAAVDNITRAQAPVAAQPTQRAAAPAQQQPKATPAAAAADPAGHAPEAPQPTAERPSASPAPARAQAEDAAWRHGFWFAGGAGYGSLGSSDDWSIPRESGGSASISMGGTLSQHVQLGGGVDVWAKSQNGVKMSVGTVTALARLYPWARGGLYVVAGLGGSTEIVSAPGLSGSTTGVGAALGLGYDIRVGRSVSLSPYYMGAGVSNNVENVNFAELGLGVKIH